MRAFPDHCLWIAKSLGVTIACLAAMVSIRTTIAAEDPQPSGFVRLLRTAGIDSASMAPLADWRGDWQAAQANVAEQILFRLGQLDSQARSRLALPKQDREWLVRPISYQGKLASIRGRVVDVQELNSAQEESAFNTIRYRCILVTESNLLKNMTNGKEQYDVLVLTPKVPVHWLKRPSHASLDEPVELTGVVLGETELEAKPATLVLTDHLAWFPKSGVPAGWVLLAKLGYDVGLLDEVRHRRPFVKPDVSREGAAFQALLKAVRGTTVADLDRQAKQAVEQRLPQWEQQARELHGQTDKRRELGIAQAAAERGKQGLSSVAPMFLTPQEETGRLERLEGTARRAVRIVPEDAPGAPPYYELEVFTNDSQNLPVVCCVASLPEGFPTGDAVRAPVRVSGFFFKSWVYRSREKAPVEAVEKPGGRPAVNLAPVVIAAGVEWIRAPASSPSATWGLWGGLAVLALAGCLWWALARASRNDRLARRRQRRYDGSL